MASHLELLAGVKLNVPFLGNPARLTPIDFDLPDFDDRGEDMLLGIVGFVDLQDANPGNGEIDIDLGSLGDLQKLKGKNSFIDAVVDAILKLGIEDLDATVFIKLRRAA